MTHKFDIVTSTYRSVTEKLQLQEAFQTRQEGLAASHEKGPGKVVERKEEGNVETAYSMCPSLATQESGKVTSGKRRVVSIFDRWLAVDWPVRGQLIKGDESRQNELRTLLRSSV
jgi:hypothetical protein